MKEDWSFVSRTDGEQYAMIFGQTQQHKWPADSSVLHLTMVAKFETNMCGARLVFDILMHVL